MVADHEGPDLSGQSKKCHNYRTDPFGGDWACAVWGKGALLARGFPVMHPMLDKIREGAVLGGAIFVIMLFLWLWLKQSGAVDAYSALGAERSGALADVLGGGEDVPKAQRTGV